MKSVKQMNMTEGSLGDKILRYTIPLIATGILQQLFNAADLAVVGQYSGKEAMAAVGSNAPIIGLLVNLFIGVALGSNVVIAKAIGQKDGDRVSDAVHTSIVISIIGGVLLALLSEFIAPMIIGLLGVPSEVYPLSLKYLRIYLMGLPVILLYNFESSIFRSCGNTRTPLIALVISGVLNVLLNLFFVTQLGMDVDGVAYATVIANVVSSLILFVSLIKTDLVVKVSPRKLRVHSYVLKTILLIGIPAGIQGSIFSLANIVIQSAVNSLGTIIMAASSAAFNLEIFAYFVINSFGQACTTFVGQNFGAGKPERCRRTLKLCLLQSFIINVVTCALILVFSNQLLGIFNPDPEVIANGRIRLEYIFFAYLFNFAQETLSGYLRGFGVSFIPALCSVVGICGIRLTWIFTVFKASPTFSTIMQVYPISLGTTAIVILIVILVLRPSRRMMKNA
ncbi:MAG: MATE family efflux transporter [Lachnospiraceae bacterium]|nr:MATE family efflux transporter [Lachnospiraceae bacterium]